MLAVVGLVRGATDDSSKARDGMMNILLISQLSDAAYSY
jgi:hypothetical protein